MRFLNALKAFILNTLFPPVCVSCKKEGDFLCKDCIKNLFKKKIGRFKANKDPDFHFLDGCIYALDYAKNPQIQAAVKQLKYRFTQDLAQYFGELIAEKLLELSMVKSHQLILIPVPLHKKRLNYRGFNQAEIIAKAVAEKLPAGKAEVIELLERERETKQQARLNKEERHENLKGAFKISKQYFHSERSRGMNKNFVHNLLRMRGGPYSDNRGVKKIGEKKFNKEKRKKKESLYFLVDDVCTTGSTLENCAEVLKENSIEKVYGLVIARAFK